MPPAVLSRYLDVDVLNRIAGLHLEPRSLVLGSLAGGHRSPLSGFAVEFKGHREYIPGDDPKHIDWRVYFNRERFVIKQYEMETNFVCHMLLDVSGSMRYGEEGRQKLHHAGSLAVTLAYAIVRRGDQVGLAVFDDDVRAVVPPSNATAQVVRMTDALDRIEPVEKTRMPECILELAGRLGRRGIVVILSDFFTDLDGLEGALQRLRYDRHEVVLVEVLHHDELDFRLEGMVQFEGLETDETILAQPEVLRDAYLRALAAHRVKLESICGRNRCDLLTADTSVPIAQTLVDYLHRRGLIDRR